MTADEWSDFGEHVVWYSSIAVGGAKVAVLTCHPDGWEVDTAFGHPRGRFASLEEAKAAAEALMEPEGLIPAPGERKRLAKEHAEEAVREAAEVVLEDRDAHPSEGMVEGSRLEETPAACGNAAAQDVETHAARGMREHERWLADYIDYARDTYPEDMAGLDHDGEVAFVMMLHQSAMERIFGEPRE